MFYTKRASSFKQIDLIGVKDQIVQLKHHKYCVILETSALNFELKSDQEQDNIIDIYESFLDSLNIDLQILIRTREVDLDKYLDDLNYQLKDETEPIYLQQLAGYQTFIRELVKNNKILTRHFYIIIPYYAKPHADFEIVKQQMKILASIVEKNMVRLGIRTRWLENLEILNLFYGFYNQTRAKNEPLKDQIINNLNNNLIIGSN